jgi:DNA polymerase-3 subunit beta
MEKDGEKLTLLATDIEIQITTQTPTIGAEKASMTVGARKLQDILRSLPESAEVSLTLDDKRLQLKAGKSRFNLQTLPAEDFPRMTTSDGQSSRLSVTQKTDEAPAGPGSICHGAAGHSLLPQRLAAGRERE